MFNFVLKNYSSTDAKSYRAHCE